MRLPSSPVRSLFKPVLISALASGGILMAGVQRAEAIIPVLSISNAPFNYTDPIYGLASFGYAFDLNGSAKVDALGLYAPVGWTTGTYKVTLYSYTATTITELDSVTFTGGNPYTIAGSYAWLPISELNLFGTPSDKNVGYLLGVNGSFTQSPSGQQGAVTTTSYNFAFPFFTEGNAFSYQNYPSTSYPIPADFDGAVADNGFFNPNLSVVPGPLPVLGAAAGFGWTRRLRKRIRASK